MKSYGNPSDHDARLAADEAMAALQSAQRELDRLRIALPAAEQQDAAATAAAAQAERQRAKDKLIAEHDRIADRYLKLVDKIAEDQAVLDTAELEADVIADQWRDANIKVDVYRERVGNDTRRLDALADQHAALGQEIAALPITAAEVAAVEQAQREAQQAAADEVRRRFDEDAAAELARIAGAQMVDVEPARIPNNERPIGWRFASGQVVAVPSRDLPEFEAAKARHAAAEAAREGARLAEQAAVALANAQAATKRPAHFSGWTEGAALRSAGATWPAQGAL
ncbi:MAG TPA: hypothetical protein VGP42_13515 [Stellaceae bacterium]|nr:hypothetical protein [Stellaceae bacterium]